MEASNVEFTKDPDNGNITNNGDDTTKKTTMSNKEITSEESNSSSTEEVKDVAVVASAKVKTVEDKALQAVLAARRKSIEEGKNTADGAKYQKRSRKVGKSEEESTTKSRTRSTIVALHLNRELQQKRRQMGNMTEGIGVQEIYTDKDRAAAVTLGDQDIKTSLRVQQKSERRIIYPDEMDSNVYLTEAQKNLTVGNLETAYNCAKKAVDTGGQDPQSLLIRSRCSLSIGKLENALTDAQEAFSKDPSLIKALLVQAEALYSMGEFERSLVLYHRGNRRRPYLAAFRKGIQKSREAILNAIGGAKFPEASEKSEFAPFPPESSVSASFVGSPERFSEIRHAAPDKSGRERASNEGDSKKSKFDGTKPLVTEIKTSKMVSKKLLGGLSSDKEFLSKLLSRNDFSVTKLKLPLDQPISGHRKATANSRINENQDNEILSDAKEALTSLQYLEAFMWQRNPSGLTAQTKENQSKSNQNSKRKKKKSSKRRIAETSSSCCPSDLLNEQGKMNQNKREIQIKEKVDSLLSRLQQKDSDDSAISTAVNDAEEYVDELRNAVEGNAAFEIYFYRLLLGLGKALELVNRSDDGLAVISSAVEFAKERNVSI